MTFAAHRARKRFGQHWLKDDAVLVKILAAAELTAADTVLEVGPGRGALTERLLASAAAAVQAVELDRDLVTLLQKKFSADRLIIHSGDALQFDFASLVPPGRKLRIVGNLPYNISSPLLFHLARYVSQVQDQHFMLQKEVVERMVAEPGSKDYGRLSVMLQWRYQMELVFIVPPEAFDPPPKVESAIVRMIPIASPLDCEQITLEQVVTKAFSQRRKLLRHTLGRWLSEHHFAGDFDVQRRAEEVPVAQYLAIARQTHHQAQA